MPTRTIFLIRHAKAESRSAWHASDHLRPLNKRGRQQSELIADALSEESIDEVRTSPAVRCVETIKPLCERLGFEPIVDRALMEGASIDLPEQAGTYAYCAHGDNIPAALEDLDVEWEACRKGSVWRLTFDDHELVEAEYAEYPT
jgi:8-oxo-dGTP diphosphatase